MVTVVGVRFKRAGKIYYFDPDEHSIEKGHSAIVETARGVEFGDVVVGPKQVPDDEIVPPLKKVIRVATDEDKDIHAENKRKAIEALDICQEKVQSHDLEMKLIDVEYTFDNNKVIFYFTADGRVDFRELVKDLASVFRTRIELRQIGVRDEAKMLNGIGPCGVGLCCANWLGDFAPVSIKMAKDQNLSLNPTKISGICGRLMCCLRYEHETYVHLRKELPRRNEYVMTPEGKAIVIEPVILKESVRVRLIINEENHELGEDILIFHKDEIGPAPKCNKKTGEGCPKKSNQRNAQEVDHRENSELVAETSPEDLDALKALEDAENESMGKKKGQSSNKSRQNRPRRDKRNRTFNNKQERDKSSNPANNRSNQDRNRQNRNRKPKPKKETQEHTKKENS